MTFNLKKILARIASNRKENPNLIRLDLRSVTFNLFYKLVSIFKRLIKAHPSVPFKNLRGSFYT